MTTALNAEQQVAKIAVVCDADRTDRYADRYETPAGVVELEAYSTADPAAIAAVLLDTTTTLEAGFWNDLAVPAAISPDLLTRRGFVESLPPGLDWVALAPWVHNADVAAGRELVASGRLGDVGQGHINTGVGVPPHPDWETDEWWALTTREAAFGAVLVAEVLLGTQLVSTRVLARSSQGLLLQHVFASSAVLTQRIGGSSQLGLPPLAVELLGDRGRIEINADFAPGTIALWDSARQEFAFPAVPLPKPNVQAADSNKGGWDIATLAGSLLRDDAKARLSARNAASKLARFLATTEL